VNDAACGFRPEDGRGWGEGGLVLLGEGAGPPAIRRLGWGRWGRARARPRPSHRVGPNNHSSSSFGVVLRKLLYAFYEHSFFFE
jgi:hypothetical protein